MHPNSKIWVLFTSNPRFYLTCSVAVPCLFFFGHLHHSTSTVSACKFISFFPCWQGFYSKCFFSPPPHPPFFASLQSVSLYYTNKPPLFESGNIQCPAKYINHYVQHIQCSFTVVSLLLLLIPVLVCSALQSPRTGARLVKYLVYCYRIL